jgi:hypothetical protein
VESTYFLEPAKTPWFDPSGRGFEPHPPHWLSVRFRLMVDSDFG